MHHKVLLTGGAGYIGIHVAEVLIKNKIKVFIIDNLVRGSRKFINKQSTFIKDDIKNTDNIRKILIQNKINTIIHLAALTNVQESEKYKKKYTKNNIIGTRNLLKACEKTFVKNIIYSSSAGVYGNANSPVTENSKLKPINYYSVTKLEGEKLIKKYSKKNKFNYCILRYFNVSGASPTGKIGIYNKSNKSLFKILAKQSLLKKPTISIFGNNFPTKDGTCVRDFIHVNDLASIHFEVCKYIQRKKKSYIFNCGYGKGFTVLEVVKKFEKIIKKKINIKFKKPRKGEIILSYSNNTKILKFIKWRPKFNNLSVMVKSSLKWEKNFNKLNLK